MSHATVLPDPAAEWLEADGAGGLASGTVGGMRTRRIGKPAQVQALWVGALRCAGTAFAADAARARAAFAECLWSDADQSLFDAVDADHVAGRADASLRPNQILAVGRRAPRRRRAGPGLVACRAGSPCCSIIESVVRNWQHLVRTTNPWRSPC